MSILAQTPTPPAPTVRLDTFYDIVLAGGPVMVPLALCSIIALAYTIERGIRTRRAALGTAGFERDLLAAVDAGGVPRALDLCNQRTTPAARVMRTALMHWNEPKVEREKAAEEAGLREVRKLQSNLKPLVYVAMLAPLLGFLGTVYGMIQSFLEVALHEGLGHPELLAAGIAQALVTTAAGLTIAIPAQVAYYWLKGRIERFSRTLEDLYTAVSERLQNPTPSAPQPAHVRAPEPEVQVAVQPAIQGA